MSEEKRPSWVDDLFPHARKAREVAERNGLIFAQRYLVFGGPTADPRAKDLLDHWTYMARRTRIPGNATPQEYAAFEGFRQFIEGIHAQMEFAAANAQSIDWPQG